jgi:hypothetical protein
MARPLKIFKIESHVAHIHPRIINDVLGAPRHVQQGNVYVVARTKAEATRFLVDAQLGSWRTSNIHEASGNHLVAFLDATAYLGTTSDVYEGKVAISWGIGGERFAVPIGLDDDWTVVGETTYKDPANPRKHLDKPVFVPAAPPAKPVRLVIELDADMDPELIERLIATKRCTIAFGRISTHEVVGKVVES